MRIHAMRLAAAALLFTLVGSITAPNAQPAAGALCGGSERWPVKMASDPEAQQIDATHVVDATVADLNALVPSEAIASNDEYDRMEVEKTIYRVHAFIGFFKSEPDGDYHIVITDETGQYAHGGATPSGHSFVAEIPNTFCTNGKHGQYHGASRFKAQIDQVRSDFQHGVAGVNGSHIPPASIPVIITGVAFFDFAHGQTGRGIEKPAGGTHRSVIELHPLLAVEFVH